MVEHCEHYISILLDGNQQPIRSITSSQLKCSSNFVDWLDVWIVQNMDTGLVTADMHSAVHITTHALVEATRYCIDELGLNIVVLGKFQADCLEDRFGK